MWLGLLLQLNPFSTENFPTKIFVQKFLFGCNFWTYINFLLDQNSRNITSLWSNILKFSKMFIKIKFLYYFIVVSRNERVKMCEINTCVLWVDHLSKSQYFVISDQHVFNLFIPRDDYEIIQKLDFYEHFWKFKNITS